MDKADLARTMLRWESMKRVLDSLEAQIQASVLELGKTQNVGNVRASYSKGRKSYDYEAAAKPLDPPDSLLDACTKFSIDWRRVCNCMHIAREEIPFTQSDPSVTVKLVE